jgi:hypothetical protein
MRKFEKVYRYDNSCNVSIFSLAKHIERKITEGAIIMQIFFWKALLFREVLR